MFTMTYAEAKTKYKQQFYNDKFEVAIDTVFPFGEEYVGKLFVTVDIPLQFLNVINSKLPLDHLYDCLFDSDNYIDPIWLSAGKELDRGMRLRYKRKLQILDGNHRIIAAKQTNKGTIKASMPQSHYNFYLKYKNYMWYRF